MKVLSWTVGGILCCISDFIKLQLYNFLPKSSLQNNIWLNGTMSSKSHGKSLSRKIIFISSNIFNILISWISQQAHPSFLLTYTDGTSCYVQQSIYIYIYNELCTVCIYIYVYIHYSVSWLDVPSLHTVSFIHSTKYRTLVKYIYKPIRNKWQYGFKLVFKCASILAINTKTLKIKYESWAIIIICGILKSKTFKFAT